MKPEDRKKSIEFLVNKVIDEYYRPILNAHYTEFYKMVMRDSLAARTTGMLVDAQIPYLDMTDGVRRMVNIIDSLIESKILQNDKDTK